MSPRGARAVGGFTLMELLIVISIVALLSSLLLPAMSQARNRALQIHCLNNQKQLAFAVTLYTSDNADWFPPIQDYGEGAESSWRPFLFQYVGRAAEVYDCPAESQDRYAGGPRDVVGQVYVAGETRLASGIGAVNVHWQMGGAQPPFGWSKSYEDNLCNWAKVQRPNQLILFGDGNSDWGGWPRDRWWIWKELGGPNNAGFNRVAQKDTGAQRHFHRSNYAFADGHVGLLDSRRIPCDTTQCWWSATADPH